MIGLAKKLSTKVLIVSTPHSREAVVYNNKGDIEKLSKIDFIIKSLCQKNGVSYLEPNITESKYYRDIVHFNTDGHKKMSKLIEKEFK